VEHEALTAGSPPAEREKAMNRHLAVVASLLALVACAPDRHGDLRSAVEVHPSDAPMLTFSGVGVGTSVADAQAAFGGPLEYPWDVAFLTRDREADFGTRLEIAYTMSDDRESVGSLLLEYSGNPVAIAKVAKRWREMLTRAGGSCEESTCTVDRGDHSVAFATVRRTWYGRTTFAVTIEG
jgi:hypothetical protein